MFRATIFKLKPHANICAMILLTIWTKIQTPIEGRKCIIVEQSHIPNIDHIFNQSFSLKFKKTFNPRKCHYRIKINSITHTEF